jgi:ABC-type branched-subunit amino acid transport system permease subunit
MPDDLTPPPSPLARALALAWLYGIHLACWSFCAVSVWWSIGPWAIAVLGGLAGLIGVTAWAIRTAVRADMAKAKGG